MTTATAAPVAAQIEPNADGSYTCPICERVFTRKQGLGRHMHETHGTPKSSEAARKVIERATRSSGLIAEVESELQEMLAPLRARAEGLSKQIDAKADELAELRKARAYVEATIRKLSPDTKTKSTTRAATARQVMGDRAVELKQQKRESLIAYLHLHRDELQDGFTGANLAEVMKEHDVMPAMSPEVVRELIEELHDAGMVRADRITRGGGMRYLLVNNNNGSTPDAT